MSDPIMERITIQATDRSPFIDFDFDKGRLVMKGESYPEDPGGFFGPLLIALRAFLARKDGASIVFDVEMAYFNSSSAKAFMNIFEMFENAATDGKRIEINWRFKDDDDTMREFGEDFGEDFSHVVFKLHALPSH